MWNVTNILSCALNSIIIVGIFLGAWHMQIDIASIGVQLSDAQKVWKNAVIHDWTLGKAHVNLCIKNTFEKVVAGLITPRKVLAYRVVWSKCA